MQGFAALLNALAAVVSGDGNQKESEVIHFEGLRQSNGLHGVNASRASLLPRVA